MIFDEKQFKIFLLASENAGRLPENDGLSVPECLKNEDFLRKGN